MKDFIRLLFQLSLAGSAAILVVLLARLALRRVPKVFSYLLWGIVLFRFLSPFGIRVEISQPYDIPEQVTVFEEPIPQIAETPFQHHKPDEVTKPVSNREVHKEKLSADNLIFIIWISGFTLMVLSGLCSSLRFHKQLREGTMLRSNIYLVDHLGSAYVIGLLRPKIYLDSEISREQMRYILAHERTHIRHLDHITRKLAYGALCIHWFNPLVWLGFYLSEKDMEMCCDEAVVKHLGEHLRKEYTKSLLSLSSGKHLTLTVAFGEGNTRSRIMNLVNLKKKSKMVTVLSLCLCILVTVLCACQPAHKEKANVPVTTEQTRESTSVATSIPTEESDPTGITVKMPNWLTLQDHGDGSGSLYAGDLEMAKIFRMDVTEDELLRDIWAGSEEVKNKIMPMITSEGMEWDYGGSHNFAYLSLGMGNDHSTYYHYIIGDQGTLYDICFEDWVMNNEQEDIVRTLAGEEARDHLKEFNEKTLELKHKKDAEEYFVYIGLYSDNGIMIEDLNDTDFKIMRDEIQIGGGELLKGYEDFRGKTIDDQMDAIVKRVQETYGLEDWTASTERTRSLFAITFQKDGKTKYYLPYRDNIYQPFTVIWFDGNAVTMDEVKEIIPHQLMPKTVKK